MKNLLFLLFLIICPVTANAERWSLNQILESSCRVQAGAVYGSGVVIDNEDGFYYILSNAHVVGQQKTVYLEFFKNGRKTKKFPGTVKWVKLEDQTEIDFALIAVDARYFGKYGPRVAKLAPVNAIAVSSYFMTAGCPGAVWPVAQEGFILEDNGSTTKFYPPPRGGASGSGLFIVVKEGNEYNTYLRSIITWRIEASYGQTQAGYENAHGASINIHRFLDAVKGRTGTTRIPDNYVRVAEVKFPRIRPNPNPEPEPVPPTPEPDVPPTPDTDNPYTDLPDFDFQTEPTLPPVDQEKLKTDRIAMLVNGGILLEEAQVKVLEFLSLNDEQWNVFVQTLILTNNLSKEKEAVEKEKEEALKNKENVEDVNKSLIADNEKLEADKIKLVSKTEEVDLFTLFRDGGVGGVLGGIGTYLVFRGRSKLGKVAKAKMHDLENAVDPLEDKVQKALENILGVGNASKLRERVENIETSLMGKAEVKINERLPEDVNNELLDEVVNSIVGTVQRTALKSKINERILTVLKG